MTKISKISYKELGVSSLQSVFECVGKACSRLGIDFFLVGAVARNCWYVANDIDAKGTLDIDFAVYISQ